MKTTYNFLITVLFIIIGFSTIYAQTFDGEWSCAYATYDDAVNGTGNRVLSVSAVSDNNFVALVNRFTNNNFYLVGYANADSAIGRLGNIAYGGSDHTQLWINGFDQLDLFDPNDLVATPDSLIYVTNNDIDNNILVFKMTADTILSSQWRMPIGPGYIWAIDIDDQGRVYVTNIDTAANQSSVVIYNGIGTEPAWDNPSGTSPTKLQEIILPDTGSARGITVKGDGTLLYVSNWHAKKVYCYLGDPVNGYTLYNGFDASYDDDVIQTDSSGTIINTLTVGPWQVNLMPDKNILFMASDASFVSGFGYQYARIYALNPNTGAFLDTLDVAQWNFDLTGGYNSRTGGTVPGNASGYASTYAVSFDENYNVYSQSYYGWTAEKWVYSAELPTIDITITSVEQETNVIPEAFELSQNYPNPFNPTTTIEFSITQRSDVTLSVYSINGEKVTDLINASEFESGVYKVTFDASKLSSGVYIYSLKAGTNSISKKMTLLK